MQHYENHSIQELPLSVPYFHGLVERFLGENGLRMEALDSYTVIEDAEGCILAGAGLSGDVIKCIAVAAEARSEGLVAPVVSHLISQAASRGITELKLFTKPENQDIFESLGFHVIARAPLAILMENGRGLERYLSTFPARAGHLTTGVVVMNATPFTLGHQYLLEQAAARVGRLFVIPVRTSYTFPYAERLAMIKAGAPSGVTVLEGSDYQISAATFPTYFLKDLSDAAETQMRLDLDLFARHIAPAIGASVRFVGSEPTDALTARYNELMKELLPEVVEIPRLETPAQAGGDDLIGHPISASCVRKFLEQGNYACASALCPKSTWPYLLGYLADRALRMELETPLKPGLVGPDSCGAHKDMDYSVMLRGIEALRPFWPRMAQARNPLELQELGIEAEKAMMEATGGVNTHRGAIFALGLALNARGMEVSMREEVMQNNLGKIAQVILRNSQNDSHLHSTHGEAAVKRYGVKGARAMAAEGYQALWHDWLPYYRAFGPGHQEESARQLTLLKIISTLDDTCVIHRVGHERAQEVKQEARDGMGHLKEMCDRYAREGISPGGAADMLALTIFIDSIIS
ncbi:MAG: triphosphoribosyl-dephospho-CoA synthase [Bacteroidales bacterium]|nr:triphosphoribosyl-dephospho-CoA synthase [Bacteroidales bacterium]